MRLGKCLCALIVFGKNTWYYLHHDRINEQAKKTTGKTSPQLRPDCDSWRKRSFTASNRDGFKIAGFSRTYKNEIQRIQGRKTLLDGRNLRQHGSDAGQNHRECCHTFQAKRRPQKTEIHDLMCNRTANSVVF